jgi:hypothetical protein
MKPVDFDSAFGKLDKNPEMIREYWRDLRASWQASEGALRRTTFYTLALAAVFLLINTKDLKEVTFLGLGLTNLNLIATLIPAVIGYLIYVISINASIATQLGDIHDHLAQHYWPKFYEQNLEVTVRPVGSYAENALIALNTENWLLSRISAWGAMARFLVYTIAPIAFEVYALWRLFNHNEEGLWLESLVTTFAFLMIVASVPNYLFLTKWFMNQF